MKLITFNFIFSLTIATAYARGAHPINPMTSQNKPAASENKPEAPPLANQAKLKTQLAQEKVENSQFNTPINPQVSRPDIQKTLSTQEIPSIPDPQNPDRFEKSKAINKRTRVYLVTDDSSTNRSRNLVITDASTAEKSTAEKSTAETSPAETSPAETSPVETGKNGGKRSKSKNNDKSKARQDGDGNFVSISKRNPLNAVGSESELGGSYSLIFKMMEKPWEMNGSNMGMGILLDSKTAKESLKGITLPAQDPNSEQPISPEVNEESRIELNSQSYADDFEDENLFSSDALDFEDEIFPLLEHSFDENKAAQALNKYPEGSRVIADLDESYDDETAADDADAQSFLSDDASEIRAERPKGFILSLGAARPWQWLTFSYAMQDNSLTFGGGKTTADVIAKSKVINLNLSHYAVGVDRRWFPVDEVPFGLFYGITLGQWQGKTARGREEGKSYSATGISSFVGLGIHVQRKNGFFWGVNILGLYKTFVVSQTGNALGGDVRGYLEDQRAFGLPNVSVGWFFP